MCICEHKLILKNIFDILFLYATTTISNKTKFCIIWGHIKIYVSKIDYTITELSHEIISENIHILIYLKKWLIFKIYFFYPKNLCISKLFIFSNFNNLTNYFDYILCIYSFFASPK